MNESLDQLTESISELSTLYKPPSNQSTLADASLNATSISLNSSQVAGGAQTKASVDLIALRPVKNISVFLVTSWKIQLEGSWFTKKLLVRALKHQAHLAISFYLLWNHVGMIVNGLMNVLQIKMSSQCIIIMFFNPPVGIHVIWTNSHHLQVGPAAMFLSQTPIQQYYTAEEGYTTQLTAFTRKQFFQVGFLRASLNLTLSASATLFLWLSRLI